MADDQTQSSAQGERLGHGGGPGGGEGLGSDGGGGGRENGGGSRGPGGGGGGGGGSNDSFALLKWGTVISGLLGLASLVGAFALSIFVVTGSKAQELGAVNLRLLLSCVACFIAMGFASIGFGLFLIRAEGVFRAAAGGEDPLPTSKFNIATTAPGLVVMVCATIVLWLALDTPFKKVEENGHSSEVSPNVPGNPATEEGAKPSPAAREPPGGIPPPPGSYSLDLPDAGALNGSAPPPQKPSRAGVGQ